MLPRVVLNTDGGSRGNPGPAGIGAILTDTDGQVLAQLSEYIGRATNNEAEYQALIQGLEMTQRATDAKKVYLLVRLDSQLVARQVEGVYKVKEEHLKPLVQEVRSNLTAFAAWRVEAVPREQNKAADRLVNEAIDAEVSPGRQRKPPAEAGTPTARAAEAAANIGPATAGETARQSETAAKAAAGQLSFADFGLFTAEDTPRTGKRRR